MPRTLSAAARAAAFAQETGEAFIVLLELEHPQFAGIIRVCSNNVGVYSGGNLYQPFPFEVNLPDDTEDAVPRVTLKIDNIDRRIMAEVRAITSGAVTVRMSVVLASSPDVIEVGPLTFTLRDVTYDAMTIEGALVYEDVLNEAFPSGEFSQSRFPGLF